MLSQNLLNLVDTAMVGQLGSAALGAVGMGGMVNWLAASFFLGLGAGVQAIAARRVGEGNKAGAMSAIHGALRIAIVLVIPLSLFLATQAAWIFSLLSSDDAVVSAGTPYLSVRFCASVFVVANVSFRGYFNGIGRSTIYLRTIVVIHVINVALNWLLIYGNWGFPRWGVFGAGLASAIAVAVGTCTYLFLVARLSDSERFFRRGHITPGIYRSLFRLSIPAGAQNLFMAAGFVTFFRIAEVLGTRELAITNVLVNLSLVCILPAMGFGLASATLVGQALGANDKRGAALWAWTTVGIACTAMLVLGGALAAFPETWLALLMNDPVAETMAAGLLVFVGLIQPVDAVGMVLSHSLIGAGATRVVMVVSIIMQWGVFLPLAYVWGLTYDGGLWALWVSLGVWRGGVVLSLSTVFLRGRWAKVVV